ncbi:hypothetical protein GOODEAATRI_003160 [Goodea atripinnis]|uniref:Uncharacterized protein n=1 Tax=Goodea atripinnis TaxID=208336 RepID=A0ABV0MNX2_9TELE
MAAAYRVVVSSVSCYNSVVVDRRVNSQAVHYCAGPCGAQSQGLDCTVAHRGTCSELLAALDPTYNDFNSSPVHTRNMISQHLPNHSKLCGSMDTIHNGGLERADSSGNLSLGEDSPTWRGKKTSIGGGSTGNLSCSGSLKDITEEAINLASGKLKEFSFDKLRLSSSSHVTLRKGRKVRPDSFSRRSTDLEIIYGHFSSSLTSTTNSMTNGTVTSNDENMPPFVLGKGNGAEEAKLKGSSGPMSINTKVASGLTSSLSSIGSLDQSLNTVASLYRTTLGEENLIARLLEKTRAEAGTASRRDDDIDKLLMDLENLSQSMSHPRTTEPPLPAKTRKRVGAQGIISSESFTQARTAQYQGQKPTSHLGMNGVSPKVTQSPTPPQGENSETVAGDEEDGALLLRILESIESFAQELVDSGAGSTGSAERKFGKEREVMRLLQDTLVTSGRADTPDSTTPPVVSSAPSMHPVGVKPVVSNHTQENAPTVLLAPAFISAASEAEQNATLESKPTSDAVPELLSKPVPDETTTAPIVEVHSESPLASEAFTPANPQKSNLLDEPAQMVYLEARSPVTISVTDDDVIADGEPSDLREASSTLLIQQTPEVIRVSNPQSQMHSQRSNQRLILTFPVF